MKKLISLLLAVSLMAVSTVASAAYLGTTTQRNPGSWGLDTNGDGKGDEAPEGYSYANSDTIRDYWNATQMACFRPGDTLTFNKGDQTVKAGDVITFICSKRGEETLDSSTVMFIDQKVATEANFSYSYKIRDLEQGGYVINIKIGDAAVKPFYFSVAKPQVEMLEVEDGKQYYIQDGVAYYFAKATIGSSEVRFEQVAEKFGFASANLEATTFDAPHFDVYAGAQEADAATFVFAIGISGFESESDLPDVEAYINE